ncbi:MAG TPA: hypothetical protein VK789_26870 [Bryobacteraceae bacterium]|jgi:hypothetical protein|nr:hypothetical protein [Bryobacteraceae bacterium]
MTSEEFTYRLPLFTNNSFNLNPPFLFNGVSARLFPLRASLDALQHLCDGYLNVAPPEACRFQAFLPYVYLMAIDYGQIADVNVVGWVSQIEVVFAVPVAWYKRVNGVWVFHDFAVFTPFIFVNDNFSMPLGRSAYGFPKTLAQVTEVPSGWLNDPVAPVVLTRVETNVFPQEYKGTRLEMRVCLEIERESPMSNFRLPFDPGSPIAPWVIAANYAQAVAGFARDATWLAQSTRTFPGFRLGWEEGQPDGPSNPMLFQQMLDCIRRALLPGGSAFVQNCLNLKQFRDAEDPGHLCFQAVTNAGMRATAFNGGGLLGEDRTFLGDLSGGHTIRLYEYASLPIVRKLGLEVHRRWRGDRVDVAELKPVLPFWIDIDMIFERGVNLAWRTDEGIWKDETGAPFDPKARPVTGKKSPEFNSTAASAIEAIAGPFSFTDTTIRVLPLLAYGKQLQKFLDDYLNEPLESPIERECDEGHEKLRFAVWARPPVPVDDGPPVGGDLAYVYLTASSFGGVTSGTNNVGDWVNFELALMIPVKLQRWNPDKGDWETTGVGLVPGLTLMDECIAAIARMEVQGIDACAAKFVRPESVWLSGEVSNAHVESCQTVLRVDAEVLPAIGVGQKASTEPLIEIIENDPDAGFEEAQSRDAPWEWAEVLRMELRAKKLTKAGAPDDVKVARALALELLGNQIPFNIYTLKQFRDISDPDKACYQSLVRVSRVLREDFNVVEIEKTLVVRIHDYPSLSIVKTLGLVAAQLPEKGSGLIFGTQAIRPFFIKATLDEPLPERLLCRAGVREWTLINNARRPGGVVAFQTLLSDEEGAPRITVDEKAETLQDQMDPSRISAVMFQAAHRGKSPDDRQPEDGPMITKEEARNAVDRVDPQTVIESVLSREWGSVDDNARWRRGRAALLRKLSALPEGGSIKCMVESLVYLGLNNERSERPGAVASLLFPDDVSAGTYSQAPMPLKPPDLRTAAGRWRNQMREMIRRQYSFAEKRARMEIDVDVLAPLGILGLAGIQALAESLGEQAPTEQTEFEQLFETGMDLLEMLEEIAALDIEGEPSANNDLAMSVSADRARLQELIKHLKEDWRAGKSREADLVTASAHVGDFRQMIDLARQYCEAQREALMNKLSRAFQKPDFCIRRDSVGADRDNLLPLSLSWDRDWYYGDRIEYSSTVADEPNSGESGEGGFEEGPTQADIGPGHDLPAG